ncbi:Nucleoside phosphorylase domain protein, partial [Metarhizium hybridum]
MEHRHQSPRPREYTVGWVCALPIELEAAEALLDEEHESLEPDLNDDNLYTFGKCCQHNVVIAGLPAGRTGNNSAAAIATRMKASFRAIRFILLVGIGGGVPSADNDIRLGDVVISQPAQSHGGVVQYDFGKEKPDGFERTGCLDCPPTLLLHAVTKLKVKHAQKKSRSPTYMNELQRDAGFKRDSAMVDVLYEAEYNHDGKEGQVCHSCSEEKIVKRKPRNSPEEFVIHYGTIASGNKLMRDTVTRDRVSDGLGGVLCFEMEAAGLMNIASCLVIRGVCDYADSHKNKLWQKYAAGTAAVCAKELLSIIPAARVRKSKAAKARRDTAKEAADTQCSTVPFPKDPEFVGREDILKTLESKLMRRAKHRRLALVGRSGVGKTQIAVEFANRVKKNDPKTRIFWVIASSVTTFIQSYRDIAENLKILTKRDSQADEILHLVYTELDKGKNVPWLLIIDSIDDAKLLLEPQEVVAPEQSSLLAQYIPHTKHCSVLVTTQDWRAGWRLCNRNNPIDVGEMTVEEATALFRGKLKANMDEKILLPLLKNLEYLPLAITQAIAFILENGISMADYLRLLTSGEEESIKLLSDELHDERRYSDVPHSVIKSFNLSFDLLKKREPRSAELLSRMCYLDRQKISCSCFSRGKEPGVDFIKDLGPLRSFQLLTADKSRESFEMHRLVQLSTKAWLHAHKETDRYIAEALKLVSGVGQRPEDESVTFWTCCHAEAVLKHTPKLLDSRVSKLGYRDPDTLQIMTDIAKAYISAENMEEAKTMARCAWALCIDVLDENHSVRRQAEQQLEITTKYWYCTKIHHLEGPSVSLPEISNEILTSDRQCEEHKLTFPVHGQKITIQESLELSLQCQLILSHCYNYFASTMDYLDLNFDTPQEREPYLREAKRLLLGVVDRYEKNDIDKYCPIIIRTMVSLCDTNNRINDFEEAKAAGLRALEMAKETQGIECDLTLLAEESLGLALYRLDELQEAEKLLRQVLRK